MKHNGIINIPSAIFLLFICIFSLSLFLPTINNNVKNPNLIIYFNTDEGGLMSILWARYSGEKNKSVQLDVDYGLELITIADSARTFLSSYTKMTPGKLLLIVRWLHSLAWIGAIIALWILVGNHFGKGWQQAVAVSLLAVRPAFSELLNSSRPEPLILLLIIVGLDHALRLLDQPKIKSFLIAVSCTSMSFIIKYQGIFLLPAIIAALYFSRHYHGNKNGIDRAAFIFSKIKKAYMLPAIIGALAIIFPLIAIFCFVRKSTGLTLFAELGIWGSLNEKKLIAYIWMTGIFLISISFASWILNKQNNVRFRKINEALNNVYSDAIIACTAFVALTLIFGYRWVLNPYHFIQVFSQLGNAAASTVIIPENHGLVFSIFQNIIKKISAFDFIIFFMFLFYLYMEVYHRKQNYNDDSLRLIMFKRMVLLVFLIAPFSYMMTLLRMLQHHMLPFFVAAVILALQGFYMLINSLSNKKTLKNIAMVVFILFLFGDLSANASTLVKDRFRQFHQHNDVVFEIAKWWRQNIPVVATVVSDNAAHVFVPDEFKNIIVLRGYETIGTPGHEKEVVEQFQNYVQTYNPEYIYYNLGKSSMPKDGVPWPDIKQMLPNKNVKLLKTFDSSGKNYQRYSYPEKHVIYKVLE